MSGGKFALPALAAGLLVQMLMAQQAAGVAAGALRGEAEDEERRKSLEEGRNRFRFQLRDAHSQIAEPDALYPAHRVRLQAMHDEILAAIEQAATERELWQAAGSIPHLLADIGTARMNQRFHAESEARHTEHRLQHRLDDLRRGLEQIGASEIGALDPAGGDAARRALAAAEAAVAANGADAASLLETAAEAIALHARRGADKQVERMARAAEQERAATEIRAILAGLRRDPMIARWQAGALARLESAEMPAAGEAPAELAAVRDQAAAMVKAASDAQLRADTRDYISRSIARSLSEMGFVVSEPAPEHPGHPATATVLQAASASGKAILVSVPVEGEVWYEVDGYAKTTSAGLSGDVVLACDEGERVLQEMHARLEEEFQVGMSEIWGEGKDPNRNLRRADSLPALTASGRDAGR